MYIQRSLVPGSISGTRSANAQNCGSEQAKTKFASNPLHCVTQVTSQLLGSKRFTAQVVPLMYDVIGR